MIVLIAVARRPWRMLGPDLPPSTQGVMLCRSLPRKRHWQAVNHVPLTDARGIVRRAAKANLYAGIIDSRTVNPGRAAYPERRW